MKTTIADIRDIAQTLREGASADIWYDADRHDQPEILRQIEATQDTMHEAATVLGGLPQLIAALRNLLEDAEALGIEGSQFSGSAIEARAALANFKEAA